MKVLIILLMLAVTATASITDDSYWWAVSEKKDFFYNGSIRVKDKKIFMTDGTNQDSSQIFGFSEEDKVLLFHNKFGMFRIVFESEFLIRLDCVNEDEDGVKSWKLMAHFVAIIPEDYYIENKGKKDER